eukprot:TRINITY_DN38600_c0_g1_i1.p1 TRINITY_DN38600_c0_g1~~TRINITY_DN38600_c0_g1_i1.p1  ORF type:complete len:387 (+),score=59.29 TRINITY_DN38600_c0_g1_i1:83-1243(+)
MSSSVDGDELVAEKGITVMLKNTFLSATMPIEEQTDSFSRQMSDPTAAFLPSSHKRNAYDDLVNFEYVCPENQTVWKRNPSKQAFTLANSDDSDVQSSPQDAAMRDDEAWAEPSDLPARGRAVPCDAKSPIFLDSLLQDGTDRSKPASFGISFVESKMFGKASKSSEYGPPQNRFGEAWPRAVLEGETDYSFAGPDLKQSGDDNASRLPEEWQGKSSVMLKNIPYNCTYHALREELEKAGFARDFDYIYMPVDARSSSSRGYAFINFSSDEAAYRFKMHFNLRKWNPLSTSAKRLVVIPANLQGFSANRTRYSSCRKLRKGGASSAQHQESAGQAFQSSQGCHDVDAHAQVLREKPLSVADLMMHLDKLQDRVPTIAKHGQRMHTK